jgi:replicative DNA helicase
MSLLDLLDEPELAAETQPEFPRHDSHLNDILTTLQAGAPEGQRNTALTRFGGLLRSQGLSQPLITEILLSVNTSRSMGLPEKEVSQIARSVSRYTPRLENRLPATSDIITVEQAGNNWREQRAKTAQCKTGFTLLDTAIPFFSIGEVLTIAGRSGTLKTTFGILLSRGIADNLGSCILFASLEMDNRSVFFRMANCELSRSTGSACSAQNTATALDINPDLFKNVVQKNGCFRIVDKDSLTLEQIEHYLSIARETSNIDLLLIDYIGYVRDTQTGSNYDKVSRIARGVKALAKRQQIRIILLCQTSREGKDGTEPVQLHHLRDSGAIEESADYIVGIWHSANEEHRLHSEILKCRNAEKGKQIDFINSGLHLIEEEHKPEPKKRKTFE